VDVLRLALDCIFERFPRLRGGCIELGASWVVPSLQQIDQAEKMFSRSEPAGEELFLLSSDYPHPEGTRDPIGRFENKMADVSTDAAERLFARNFIEMMSGQE